jgi:hypothetical protein
MRRLVAAACLALAATDCRDGPSAAGGRLAVTPADVACVAGDQVALAATDGDRAVPATFTVTGDGAWLATVDRARGSATLRCEAAGDGVVAVEGAGQHVGVPVTVDPPPDGTLRLTLTPDTLSLVNGTAAPLVARVTSTRPGERTEPRYRSDDTAVAEVDSVFGLVTATGPGTAVVTAAARADRRVRATATVMVVRGSTFVDALTLSPAALSMVVGDSGRVVATVQLAPNAPPGTSRAVLFRSDDPTVAVVSSAGVVRGVGQGGTYIVAAPAAAPRIVARVPVAIRVPAP